MVEILAEGLRKPLGEDETDNFPRLQHLASPGQPGTPNRSAHGLHHPTTAPNTPVEGQGDLCKEAVILHNITRPTHLRSNLCVDLERFRRGCGPARDPLGVSGRDIVLAPL